MQAIENYEQVRDFSEVQTLPPGPQCCKITDVINNPEKAYLEIRFDIVKGDYTGYFAAIEERTGNYPNGGKFIRSYKPTALGFFKATITAIEKSNSGYNFVATNWDEKSLIGKFVVVNFREEEYVSDGELKVSVKPFEFRSIEAYKKGDVKIPERKKLSADEANFVLPKQEPVGMPLTDDELPF